MVRPRCCRTIGHTPPCRRFRPQDDQDGALAGDVACGPDSRLPESEDILLYADELEALRLADAQGMYHEQAAALMGVSRPTFGRILTSARQKVAGALCQGKGIRIEIAAEPDFSGIADAPTKAGRCPRCQHPLQTGRPKAVQGTCPYCPKATPGSENG